MAPSNTQSVGSRSEEHALAMLVAQGLRLVTQNFRSRFGEIDLVMLEGSCLVFVEVRMRDTNRFYSAAESVGPVKQRKLVRTARFFLGRHRQFADSVVRFDVVAIDGMKFEESKIQWIKDAFRPGDC